MTAFSYSLIPAQAARPVIGMIVLQADETLESIIERKLKEIDSAGFALWGYGGNTCHPTTMVQPFAEEQAELGQSILLCMEPMESKHSAPQVRATEYSEDGVVWEEIPQAINCVGSRYALRITDLAEANVDVKLSETEVALGRNRGRAGHSYVGHQVDKACLIVRDGPLLLNDPSEDKIVPIRLTAKMEAPYAVFVKSG